VHLDARADAVTVQRTADGDGILTSGVGGDLRPDCVLDGDDRRHDHDR